MGRSWIWIKVVRTDLKRNQRKCFKTQRLDYWHVLRGLQTRTRNNRAGARSYEGYTASNRSPNWFDQLILLQLGQQSERVAAAGEDDFRLLDCARSIGNVVYRSELKPHLAQAVFRLFRVCPALMKCIWNEHNANSLADKILDLSLSMVEVSAAMQTRVADQEQ